jgi:hypothetical protein
MADFTAVLFGQRTHMKKDILLLLLIQILARSRHFTYSFDNDFEQFISFLD